MKTLLILTLLLFAQSASAAVAYVDHTVDAHEALGNPDSNDFQHIVPAGDNRYLIVAIHSWNEDCSAPLPGCW